MSNIDWRKLSRKEIKPPFIPNVQTLLKKIVSETKEYLEEIQCYNDIN